MRAAPAVAVRCTGGWAWRLFNWLLPALVLVVVAAWALLHLELDVAAAAGVGVLALWVGWRWSRPASRLLQWDGQRWTVDGTPGRLQLMVDVGFLLLLRLHPERGAGRWLAVASTEAGPAWHALRAAVYARPPAASSAATRSEGGVD